MSIGLGLSLDSLLVVSLRICRWLFHCWWIFLRRWMFFWGGFGRVEEWMDWFDWMRGMVGYWPKVFLRARVCALPSYEFCFLLSQVSQRMELKILHHPQNDVSFYWKPRVVLLKTTYRFTENIVSFCWKQRVVLWKVTGCFGLESEKWFCGWCLGVFLGGSSSVKVWYFLNVVSVIGVNGYYIMGYKDCVTLVTAKNIKLLYCAHTSARIARCYFAFYRAWPLHAV